MGGSSSKPLEGVDRGKLIDEFKAKWIGSIPVRTQSGKDVAAQSVERLKELKAAEVSCVVQVTTKGVYLLEAGTLDPLKEVDLNDVSYVTQDKSDLSVVTFFENYQQLHLIMSHAVKLKPVQAARLAVAINEAYKLHRSGGDENGEEADGENGGDGDRGGRSKRPRRSRSGSIVQAGSRMRVSYKKALKEHAKEEEAELESAQADRSRVIVEQTGCHFVGSMVVEDKAKASDIQGHMRSIAQANKKSKGVPCTLIISEARVRAVAAKGGKTPTFLFDVPITSVTKCDQNKTVKKTDLALVAHDERLDTVTAYLLVTPPQPPQEEVSLKRHLHNTMVRQREKMRDRRDSKTGPGAIVIEGLYDDISGVGGGDAGDDFKLIGNYEATYLGKCFVDSERVPTEDVKERALKGTLVPGSIEDLKFGDEAVRFVRSSKAGQPKVCVVQVSDEGIRRIDANDLGETRMFSHSQITCTHVVDGTYLILYLAAQGKKKALALVFACIGRRADDIRAGIKRGVKAAELARKADPFAAISGRTPAPSSLFARQVHRGELKALSELGAGAFGVVYKAEQTSPDGVKAVRAVKTLRQAASDADKDEFVREAEACLQFNHDNVCKCIGVAVQQRPWLIVLEFLEYGDLQGLLEDARQSKIKLRLAEMLQLCLGVCKGMEHISSKRFIHMDLAARNVLVAQNNVTKITDFGLARQLPKGKDYWRATMVIKLPVKWCALESMSLSIFSVESDVWSCGVTLWEIFSYGKVPYGKVSMKQIPRKIKDGLRLQKPKDFPTGLWSYTQRCFAEKRKNRPSFKDLAVNCALALRNESTASSRPPRDIGDLIKSAGEDMV